MADEHAIWEKPKSFAALRRTLKKGMIFNVSWYDGGCVDRVVRSCFAKVTSRHFVFFKAGCEGDENIPRNLSWLHDVTSKNCVPTEKGFDYLHDGEVRGRYEFIGFRQL